MSVSRFETPLSGGHPNSLGNTVSVVDEVLADRALLAELVACYRSDDPVVRLRVSSAVKRVAQQQPEWVAAYLDEHMTSQQRDAGIAIMQSNIHFDDWIVQSTTAESLAHFARQRPKLVTWLVPELQRLTASRHKSVRGRARKLLASMSALRQKALEQLLNDESCRHDQV